MTILEALIEVAVNFDTTAKSMNKLAEVMKGVAEKTKGTPAIDAVAIEAPCQVVEEKGAVREKKHEVTIEQIRAVLAEKSQEGLTAKVKDLLDTFGAPKLSAVKAEDYEKLLAAAQKIK